MPVVLSADTAEVVAVLSDPASTVVPAGGLEQGTNDAAGNGLPAESTEALSDAAHDLRAQTVTPESSSTGDASMPEPAGSSNERKSRKSTDKATPAV